MNHPNINLPREVLTPENLRYIRKIAKRKDEKPFKRKISYYLSRFREENPSKDKKELEKIAMSYLGAMCLIADRGYLTIGIPYPPAKLGPVEKRFLKIYDPENYNRFKKINWQRDWI